MNTTTSTRNSSDSRNLCRSRTNRQTRHGMVSPATNAALLLAHTATASASSRGATVKAAVIEARPHETASAYHLYLREIGPIKLLTAEEEVELGRRVRQGDETARDLMIKSNLKLVVKIAHDFEDCGVPLLDLIAEGNLGLIKAVERFDPTRGARLASYASFWIKQFIRRAVANQSRTVRLPVHVHERLFNLHRVATRLQEVLGRSPSDEELADEMGISVMRVGRLRRAAQGTISLDASLGDADSEDVGSVIPDERAVRPDEPIDREHWQSAIESCLHSLSSRELTVLRERFGLNGAEDHTLEEVGSLLGLTRERIRQIQNTALRKLRAKLESHRPVSVAA